MLNHDGRNTRREREREERHLLSDMETGTLQRPDVEQQQHDRQCYHHRLGHQRQREQHDHREVPSRARAAREAHVGENRQQPEERAEHILALGDPGHRLHVQRMSGKHGGDKRTPPRPPGRPPEQLEDQDRVGRVKDEVRDVIHARVAGEQRHVEQV